MKDLVRMKTSLSEEIEALLNGQVKMEAKSSSIYLAMAAYCDRLGFENSSEFFFQQAEEERQHMLKIFRYIADAGGTPVSPDVANVPQEFGSFRGVYENALEQEIEVTNAINKIVSAAYKGGDHTTANFLQWFISEQQEEEFTARKRLELFDVIGEEGIGAYMIDQKIPEIGPPTSEDAEA
ncbi:MAG: ferritin [Cyclobacteriaceae bacterium]|nr:ferritin [Cyclobacteriaceae bacterium]